MDEEKGVRLSVRCPPEQLPLLKHEPHSEMSMTVHTKPEIITWTSPTASTLVFENQLTRSTFFVNAIPETDNSERKIMIVSNDKPIEPARWILKRETTSKDAIKALKEWGGSVKEMRTLSDFLDSKLRSVSIEKESVIKGSAEMGPFDVSAGVTRKAKTDKSV